MDDPIAVAAAHDAQESTPLLRGDTSNNDRRHHQHKTYHYDEYEAPKWYWPWPAAYWAAIPVIFLAGLAVGPAMAMTSPLAKLLFCERGIPDLFKDKNSDHLLIPGGEKDCDSPEYSAAIAKFTVYYNKGTSLYFLWVGGMVEGCVGSILCLIALVHSYAADVSSPQQRTVVFGRMIAGWYAGLGIGSAIGGLIAKRFGMITVFWMLPIITFVDVLYVLIIPESLTVVKLAGNNKAKMTNSQSQATLIDVDNSTTEGADTSLRNPIKPATILRHQSWVDRIVRSCVSEQLPHRLGGKYSIIVLMITCFFTLMSVMGAMYQSSVYLLYKFKWTGTELSYMGAIQGLSRLVSLTVLLPIIKKLAPSGVKTNPVLGINFDLKVMIMGLWLEAVTMLIYAVAPIGEYFYVGGATGAIGSLFFPATRGILSQSVAPEMLGKTLGTLATFESLAAAIAPSLYAWIYALTLRTHPSLVFYVAAGVIMLASGLAISVAIAHKNEMKHRT
ncbi:hypothetical protein BG015_001726 [Linnemannia schmuckeri]|uniref:Uncharacterized protein n=1 Tax=Linnemannia schmuckeri TaxID=64567 RepID=A0A9P5VDN8_9FUNG|nr:hypothetical protein BG015_001726 [Linnemannia schmuckeri]